LFSLHDILDSGEGDEAVPAKRRHEDYGYDEYDDSGSEGDDGPGHGEDDEGDGYGGDGQDYPSESGGDESQDA
jgi:hypothetical protein